MTSRELFSDSQADLLTREQLLADPELRQALEAWEKRDDSLVSIAHVSWALEYYGISIVQGAADFAEAAELAEGVDDEWCETVRKAVPHLKEAAAIIAPMVTQVAEVLEARRLAAIAKAEELEETAPSVDA